jgi:hypothetical protein
MGLVAVIADGGALARLSRLHSRAPCQKLDRSKPERANVSFSLSRMPVV